MPSKDNTKSNRLSPSAAEPLRFGRVASHLIHNMPLGVVAFDAQLNITDSNSAAKKMLADHANIATALTAGSIAPPAVPWEQQLTESLAQGEPQTFENVPYSLDSKSYVLHIICTPFIDQGTDQLRGGILLIEDITSKVVMENDLASAERLAAVGKLAARVAHELNNPLDGIIRYINLALRVIDQDAQPQARQYLEHSHKGLLRMVRIVSELLEFSRSTYSSVAEADINKIVEDAIKAMEGSAYENNVHIERHFSGDMPNVRSGNLFQVFCNLIKNAVDAMPDGGTLEITTRYEADVASIEFVDTGSGLSDEVAQKLFEPFFTTKAPGKGTGLGLAICKDIIEKYNGQITAADHGGGSVFTVTIPGQMSSGPQMPKA